MKRKAPTATESPGLYYLGEVAKQARRSAEAVYAAEREAKLIEEDSLVLKCLEATRWVTASFPVLSANLTDEQIRGIARGLARALVSTAGRSS